MHGMRNIMQILGKNRTLLCIVLSSLERNDEKIKLVRALIEIRIAIDMKRLDHTTFTPPDFSLLSTTFTFALNHGCQSAL